ncbi:MAG: hypothetical protein WBG58_06725, partial [Ignavibacteriaceae bacterium]
MPNAIWDAFSPFAYFDMASFYETYSTVIDGIIFFSLFLGIAKFALQKKFPGRPGNAIAIALSFALTIGLLAMENTFGFNLKSLSGIALGAIFVITGFFMITLARSAGIGSVNSFAITYCLLYLGTSTTLPNLFDYISDHTPWLNGMFAFIFLISLFIAVRATVAYLFSKKKLKDLPAINPVNDNTDQEIRLQDEELHKLKHLRHKLQTVDDLMDALTLLEKSIKKHPVLTQEQVDQARHYLDSI